MIDLFSDTMTRPSPAMRRAMAEAPVADEQKREDPTTNHLQEMVAGMLGKEAAVFMRRCPRWKRGVRSERSASASW